jgi:putative transposase
MLRQLEVSRFGYYDYFKRKPCKQKIRKDKMTQEIKSIHQESKKIYGSPKITEELKKSGHGVSEKYVGNIMREHHIKAYYIKPYTTTTKDCDFSKRLQNILKRNFSPTKPNAAWCTDITYIWTYEDGFVYLTSIMDLYSRKIIAWTLSKTMEKRSVKMFRGGQSKEKNRNASSDLW